MIAIHVPTSAELKEPAPDFMALTDEGPKALASFRGQWLALMYCPKGACAERAECLQAIEAQTREIAKMGGRLLVLHPPLGRDDRTVEQSVARIKLRSLLTGTSDAAFTHDYGVSPEGENDDGITGVFLIDPQGRVRAAARYAVCAPVVAHEIVGLMRVAIEKYGRTGGLSPVAAAASNVDRCYGCVEWFSY